MTIRYHRRFERKLQNLPRPLREKVVVAIARFVQDPRDPTLHNHPLHGRLAALRAFSVGGDLRVIVQEFDNYTLVLFLDIGTHERVYG